MAVIIVATPNAADANSFLTLVEAKAYWATRLWTDIWENSEDQSAALVQATRMIVALLAPRREFVAPTSAIEGYFINHPTWTGAPTTPTQRLPWGRIGMFDRNGNAILSTVIPQELKDATAEFAGHLSKEDRLMDYDVAVQGLTSVKAGSVSIGFKNDPMITKIVPDSVLQMLVPSWLTNLTVESMYPARLDVIS